MSVLPHLTVAFGGFAQAPLGLGCVGEGEVGEESHDRPPPALTLAKVICWCFQH
jgi:hypothetical protein